MNIHSFLGRLRGFPVLRWVFLALVVLAWSGFVFGGEIHDAAVNGNLEKVKALLKENPNLVFSKDDIGKTPLHHAALLGHKGMVELLLANKAEADAKDNYGRTASAIAAVGGYKDLVELLRQHIRTEPTNTVPSARIKPAATNAVPTTATKPATAQDSKIDKATKSADSKPVKASPKAKPAAPVGTNNRGRIPVRSAPYKDSTELLRKDSGRK
jgi:hypothetical protein